VHLYSLSFQLFLLEELRSRKYHTYAQKIQRAYRRYAARRYFLELKEKCKENFIFFFFFLFSGQSKLRFSLTSYAAQDIFYQKKERKRISLKREYIGDYIGYLDNPGLRSLLDKKERVLFADDVNKYDRRYKPQKRTLLLTAKDMYLIALVTSSSLSYFLHLFCSAV
jgi:myosin-1